MDDSAVESWIGVPVSEAMSTAAWGYARQNFDQARADQAWRDLLLEARP